MSILISSLNLEAPVRKSPERRSFREHNLVISFSCHLPVLYIGLEYGLTNNTKLAERFFTQALTIAPDDPFVLHEMGVISFQNTE